jgi:hypothetical protein
MADFKEKYADFPDLLKAEGAESITALMKGFIDRKEEPIEIVQETKDKIDKQRVIDFRSFIESQGVAVERGNRNACADQKQFTDIADQQNRNAQNTWADRALPYSKPARLYGTNPRQIKLPKAVSAGAIKAGSGASKRPTAESYRGNQGRQQPLAKPYQVATVTPSLYEDKAKGNYQRFVKAQAGKRGTAIGDRAVVFSQNGTPHYGDSILDKSLQENLSANVAAAAPPVSAVPSQITTGAKLPAKDLTRGKNGQITPKGDTVTAGVAFGVAAAAITLIMFPLQYIVNFFTFMLQLQTATSNIRNIATSTTTFISNIGYLLGFGKDALVPVEKGFDGILNNVFGKEKVDYVKLQFAKLSVAVNAAVNIVDSVRDMSNALGNAVQEGARNTSKIGNALKAARVIDSKFDWMDEKISASRNTGTFAEVNNALAVTGQVTNELSNITRELKEAADEAAQLEKEAKEKAEREKKDHTGETSPKYVDQSAPVAPAIRRESI